MARERRLAAAKPGPYTEPANVPHNIEIEEEVVLQVSGTGPSGRKFVDRPDGAK